jgi:hypothetical protein
MGEKKRIRVWNLPERPTENEANNPVIATRDGRQTVMANLTVAELAEASATVAEPAEASPTPPRGNYPYRTRLPNPISLYFLASDATVR